MDEDDVFGLDPNIFSECMLERGLYPENIPPVFSIVNFHEASLEYLNSKEFISKKPNEPAIYNSSKRGGSRRNFEIPNPTLMVDAAIFFCSYRSPIFEHFQATDDSLSVPRFYEEGRTARITSSAELHRIRRQKLSTSRYVVKTDISRFFHSVYTHSIPWALHGKSSSKKDRNIDSISIFGNRLDQILRQAKDGQTVGISVGPDFSRYASEIIGKAIDRRFRDEQGDQCVIIRHVDDFFIGADDYDEAIRFLNGIREAVQEFQLDLNERKTSIVPTNLDLEPFWPVQIRREIEGFKEYNPRTPGSTAGHDLVYFLDQVIRIANEEKDEGVIKYALRKMDDFELWSSYWQYVEPFLIRSSINFPHCWDYVSRIAAWRHRVYGIDTKIWGSVVGKALSRLAPSGYDSEITWALWLAREAELKIDLSTLEMIIDKCGAISVTIAIDVFQRNKHPYTFPKAKLLDRLGDQPMLGSDWLLSYEADRLFGFKLKSKNMNGFSFSSELYENDTEFYNTDALPVVFEGVEDPKNVGGALESDISHYDDDYSDEDDDSFDSQF